MTILSSHRSNSDTGSIVINSSMVINDKNQDKKHVQLICKLIKKAILTLRISMGQ